MVSGIKIASRLSQEPEKHYSTLPEDNYGAMARIIERLSAISARITANTNIVDQKMDEVFGSFQAGVSKLDEAATPIGSAYVIDALLTEIANKLSYQEDVVNRVIAI